MHLEPLLLNYTQLEKEVLSVVFGFESYMYVYDRKALIQTDHKPLEAVIKKNLMSAKRRLGCKECSLRTADVFPVVTSLPSKNNVCEPERQNDFRDVKPL